MSDERSDTPSPLSFAGTFPAADAETWRKLATEALKGGDFERRLVSRTANGDRIEPVYPRAAGDTPVGAARGAARWRVAQRVDHPEPDVASAMALADLEGGADTLSLVFPAGSSARGFGIDCDTVAALDRTLNGVALEMIALRVEPAPAGRINAATVAALVARRGHRPSDVTIDFGLDPLGSLVTLGAFSADWTEVGRRLADTTGWLRGEGFAGPFIACDMRCYHEAGASEVQELATALSTGVAYWRALEAAGVPVSEAEPMLGFTFAVDADQFMGLAKLRAMRRLWARVQEAAGLPQRPISIHAETAWRMMTRRDAAVNMLRATIATFSAGVGGADSLTVLPYTLALGLPDSFARRVARNTQMVLLEESNLWRVVDPAAGSGAFAALTDDLCAGAWAKFQEIERAGGIVETLRVGTLQQEIAELREHRLADVAKGKTLLTGTSAFPLIDEWRAKVLDVAADSRRGLPRQRKGDGSASFAAVVAALADGGTRGDVMPPPDAIMTVPELPSTRLAEPFEALRDRADRATERLGQRPAVFIANIGSLADSGTRTMWTRNLLAAGGVAAQVSETGFTNSGDVGLGFAQSGLQVACICGSDATYAELGEATAQALRSAGATRVLLAGRPGNLEAALRAAGVDAFLAAGQDAVTALMEVQDALGIGH